MTNNLDEDELTALRFYLPNDTTVTPYSYEEATQKGYQQKDLIIDLTSVEEMLAQEELADRRRWTPSGRITVHEDGVNRNVGVMGAEIKVRKWGLLVIRRAHTDRNGNFRTRRTRTKRVKYAIHFNYPFRFRVMAGSIFVRAKHRGTRRYKRKPWNQHFSYGRSKFYALVHNATYDFYDRAVGKFGLQHPNQSWLRVSARYNGRIGDSRHSDINVNGGFPWVPLLGWKSEIQVGRLNNGSYWGSDLIYGVVTHEMAHASHYRMDRSFFLNIRFLPKDTRCKMRTLSESWAEGVETIVTNHRYNSLSNNYVASTRVRDSDVGNFYNSRRQEDFKSDIDEYTPIVADLIEDYNQREERKFSNGDDNPNRPNDRVKGYSLRQIQSALKNSRGAHGWKERLKDLHHNPTEEYVDELFNEYMYNRKCN